MSDLRTVLTTREVPTLLATSMVGRLPTAMATLAVLLLVRGQGGSYTLAGGHEFEEAVTDPDNEAMVQDGWNDYQTSENGDKCAYFHSANLKLGTHVFAVQPMWSNEANGGKGGCAMHRGTGAFPVPSTP